MNRRQFLPMLSTALLVGGCADTEKAVRRFRVIATAEVDGKLVEASNVMEIHYSRLKHSATGAGVSTRLYGETLIFDIKGKGTVFVIPYSHWGPSLIEFYEHGIPAALGIKSGIGSMSDQEYERLRTATERVSVNWPTKNRPVRLPAMIAFEDERRPETIFEVYPGKSNHPFPGVRIVDVEIEFTEAPVTKILLQRLPWLVRNREPLFPRDPPGPGRRLQAERPIGYKITQDHFFADGSR